MPHQIILIYKTNHKFKNQFQNSILNEKNKNKKEKAN